jgi:hypothetical protein
MLIVMIALGIADWSTVPATAAPVVPEHRVKVPSNIVQVWGGCGWGFHQTYWGGCIPNRSYYYRPYWRYRQYGYYRPSWRYRYWHRRR